MDKRMEDANNLFTQGKFIDAAQAYEAIYNSGVENEALCFNLGNAWFKSGNLAKAILFYERALLIDPDDKDVLYNLELANTQTADRIDQVGEFFISTWVRNFRNKGTSDFWAYLSIGSFIVLLVFIGLYLYSGVSSVKRISFFAGMGLALLVVISVVFAGAQKNALTNQNYGIIFTPTVNVKSSPDASGTDLFVIHEGTKIKILEALGSWKKIQLKDGSQGWLPAQDFEVI
jgi:tetratricopeptide (TPR) repeat protein